MLCRDSKGRRSWTVTLILPAWFLLVVKFALSGIKIGETVFASIDVISFGTALTAIIAPLVARDALKDRNASTPPADSR